MYNLIYNNSKPFLLILLSYIIFSATDTLGNYEENSGVLCSSGKHQSPIYIDSDNVEEVKGSLHFSRYNEPITIENINKHNITVNDAGNIQILIQIQDGLKISYTFDHLHFHTGCTEHAVDGKTYSAELHMVHYKTEYKSISNAKSHSDGIAVIGILYKESDEDNSAICHIIEKLRDDEVPLKSITLKSFLPSKWHQFYTYKGSLTTGNCDENVQWIVFRETSSICSHQIYNLKKLLDTPCRPLQSINGRNVQLVKNSSNKQRLKLPIFLILICNFILFNNLFIEYQKTS